MVTKESYLEGVLKDSAHSTCVSDEFNRVIIPVKRGEENTDYVNASFIDVSLLSAAFHLLPVETLYLMLLPKERICPRTLLLWAL